MTTAKDAHPRPSSQHRLSVGSTASSLPSHKSRPHSHSLSIGSIKATARRKSTSKPGHRAAYTGSYLGPGSIPNSGAGLSPSSYGASVLTDGPPLASIPMSDKGAINKSRIRRASEGSRLSKGEGGKRVTNGELRCDECGKGYKHSSCLTKHLWEHTPQWSLTSKLLISKHQQVQLLEAAKVLVEMNQLAEEASDNSTSSPAASSDDRESSADLTPPPDASNAYAARRGHRFSSASSYSHSYTGNSVFSDSMPSNGFYSHSRQWSTDGRPTTSGTSVAGSNHEDEDSAELAGALNLLSCSHGTQMSGNMKLPPGVPPVPELPPQYRQADKLSASHSTVTPGKSPMNGQHMRYDPRYDSRDVRMAGADDSDEDDAHDSPHDHEEIFGEMEV